MDDRLIEIAVAVADDCVDLRDKFAIAVHRLFYSNEAIRGKHELHADAAYPVITAFQLVQNAYFAKKNKYIPEEQLGDFIASVCIRVEKKVPSEALTNYLKQYEINMQKPYPNQLEWFCQDAATAIVGSDAGMIYGMALLPISHDFLLRNWALVAAEFGDETTSQMYIERVRTMHNKSSS